MAAPDDLTRTARRDALLARLRSHGMRHTVARGAVIDALLTAPHQSAAQIHARIADRGIPVDLPSVRRIIDALTTAGLVHILPTPTGPTYGPADRAHHHTVCTTCGHIQEIPAEQLAPAIHLLTNATGQHLPANDPTSGLVLYAPCTTCTTAVEPQTGRMQGSVVASPAHWTDQRP